MTILLVLLGCSPRMSADELDFVDNTDCTQIRPCSIVGTIRQADSLRVSIMYSENDSRYYATKQHDVYFPRDARIAKAVEHLNCTADDPCDLNVVINLTLDEKAGTSYVIRNDSGQSATFRQPANDPARLVQDG